MSKFEMLSTVKYRDAIGGWHPLGFVGARVEQGLAVQASIYLHGIYMGRCFSFPFEDKELPYLHGHLLGDGGNYEDKGIIKKRWLRCGFIFTTEIDGSDFKGETRSGNQFYTIQINVCPIKPNKKGTAFVLTVKHD